MNPAIILALLISVCLAAFGGYRHGVNTTNDKRDAADKVAMTAMIDRHNELEKADVVAAIAAEKQRQTMRIKQLEGQHEIELAAARNHRPECSLAPDQLGLLNDLIDSANGRTNAAPGLRDGVRPPAESASPGRSGGQGLGGRRSARIWRMSI